MNIYFCDGCETKFQADRRTLCPQCGGIDVTYLGDIASQKLPEPQTGDHPEKIRDILKELCLEAYDKPYNGIGWEESINKALDKLTPYLTTEQIRR